MSKQGENNNKSNVLSMDSVRQKHQQEFKMAEAHVNLNEEMFSYKYYEKFPNSLKDEYVQEFMEYSFNMVADGEREALENSIAIYALILLVDKFTDIEVPVDNYERILFASYLSDFELLNKIINTFEEEEVSSIMALATDVAEQQTTKARELVTKYEGQGKDIEAMGALRVVEDEIKKLDEEDSGGKEDN